ncbi:MAG: phosphatase PAP2 family protein [Pirellulaceae bacterium]
MLARRKPTLEFLESRRVLASVWQAASNPYDVDESGLVVASDVLLIANDINQNGTRELPANKPTGFAGPLCDVNGDGRMSAADALLVVNVINRYPTAPQLSFELNAQDDPNSDEIVLDSDVVYEGQTTPESRVLVEFLEGEQVLQSGDVQVNELGQFTFPATLPAAINHLRVSVTDLRGRKITSERVTRVGDVTTTWNAALLEMVRETTSVLTTGDLVKPPPPMVSKYLAMVHGAMFDAMNATTATYRGYAFESDSPVDASPIAAAAQAAHVVASHLYSSEHQVEIWDKTLQEVLATVPESAAKTAGIQLGQQAGQAMIAKRVNDGSELSSDYSPTAGVGNWKPTLPNFAEPTLPQWPNVTPFVLSSGNQFRPLAPPALESEAYASAVDEVLKLGERFSSLRTADQTAIAHFWEDGGGTATPPGHWNSIATDVALSQSLPPLETARLFALLNLALADAGISAWDAKYFYDFWRPIDAIREAADDQNSETEPLNDWLPLLPTPSFPTYTSGHSTFSGAAAAVLTAVLGDNFAFTSRADRGSSGQWPPSDDVSLLAVRSFESFVDAAQEAGLSRIYGGIHFDFDNTAGLESGALVGEWIVQHALLPI